jgi:hypothetical protein
MNWFLKWAGWQAYAVFAAAVAVLAALWFAQVAGLRAEISDAEAATSASEKQLSDRIAVESTAIADAVTKARDEEQTKLKTQEVKYEKLLQSDKTNRLALDSARGRLRTIAATSSAGRSCAGSPANSPTPASTPKGPSEDGLRPEDRKLIDELLQIAGDAKQVAEERNFIASEYIEQCERK